MELVEEQNEKLRKKIRDIGANKHFDIDVAQLFIIVYD